MKNPTEAHALRPLPNRYDWKTIIAQTGIHITSLLSAMAIAASDRIMPSAAAKQADHA